MFNKYVYIIVCNTILYNMTPILTKLDFECDSGKKRYEKSFKSDHMSYTYFKEFIIPIKISKNGKDTSKTLIHIYSIYISIYIYTNIYMHSLQCKVQEINFQSQRDFKFGALYA